MPQQTFSTPTHLAPLPIAVHHRPISNKSIGSSQGERGNSFSLWIFTSQQWLTANDHSPITSPLQSDLSKMFSLLKLKYIMCFIEGTKFICLKVWIVFWVKCTNCDVCLYCIWSEQHMEDICLHLDCSFFSLAHILSYRQWTFGMNDFSTHRVKTIKHCLGFNYFTGYLFLYCFLLSSLQSHLYL